MPNLYDDNMKEDIQNKIKTTDPTDFHYIGIMFYNMSSCVPQ